MRTLDLVYFDAGGGHRSAALALQAVIGDLGYPWQVRLVNLQEVLDSLDVFRKLTGIRLEDIYNLALAKGWTLGSNYLLPCMHGVIRLYHGQQVKLLTRFWQEQRPDLVVSLVPNFNRALFQSLTRAVPGVSFVTILTDLADYPPHFWMERQDQYLICGTDRAVEQARAMGYRKERVFQTSGMILRPDFYNLPAFDQAEERSRLGLDPDLATGLVLFGGEGSNVMFPIAKQLGNSALDLQLIMICGRNGGLRERLGRLKTRNTIVLEGFTKVVPRYMRLADFFIGKPGPGSISEALHLGLPVIVERNAWTLPQERYNAQWLAEKGVGIVLRNFREIDRAVQELLIPGAIGSMKQRIAGMKNGAVFEIPPLLEQIFKIQSQTCAAKAQL
ncbi:MAG: galactosyldiacylglycerol synthase [Acidobacteriota bacterium]|nr:galactosyldiacylglycerol synthase [Acidobacteriota bacterium]